MVVCELTRLRSVVLVGCFVKVSLGQAALRSACINKVPTSPRFAQNSMLCAVLHHSEVMVLMRRTLFFAYDI